MAEPERPVHFTTREAASRIGVSPRTLEHWRITGDGPAYLKLCGAVRYTLTDLEAWEAECRRKSTSEPMPPDRRVTA